MRRIGVAVLVVLGCTVWGAGEALAGADNGQFCVDFDQHDDTILIDTQHGSGPATMFRVFLRWRGADAYQLLGAGVMTQNSEAGTKASFPWMISASLTNGTIFFNGQQTCAFTWYADGVNFAGPWKATCVGVHPAGPFLTGGTMRWNPNCVGSEAPSQSSGKPLAGITPQQED